MLPQEAGMHTELPEMCLGERQEGIQDSAQRAKLRPLTTQSPTTQWGHSIPGLSTWPSPEAGLTLKTTGLTTAQGSQHLYPQPYPPGHQSPRFPVPGQDGSTMGEDGQQASPT